MRAIAGMFAGDLQDSTPYPILALRRQVLPYLLGILRHETCVYHCNCAAHACLRKQADCWTGDGWDIEPKVPRVFREEGRLRTTSLYRAEYAAKFVGSILVGRWCAFQEMGAATGEGMARIESVGDYCADFP